ncbi:MAG: hypothetical protein DME65_11910 [Verrucomicrobia bacterium]|nr:MAG: hypothetical protein DME65_11910 [Verrucomicrobiota bacterium]
MKRTFTHLLIAISLAILARADQTVQSVQQALKDQGLYYGNVTGDKSAETTAAIRRYQIRNGLQVTGEISPETLQSLNLTGVSSSVASSHPGSKPAVTQSKVDHPDQSKRIEQNPSPQSQDNSDRQPEINAAIAGFGYRSAPARTDIRTGIAELQRQLTMHGYYHGRIDGRYGRQTALALREFRFASGLPATGHLDMSALDALGLSNANLAYLNPAPRSRQVWVPITKLKHRKWEVKWKKLHRDESNEHGDTNQREYSDAEDRDE